jgi:CDP-diacylglycerol--glycerol-3-phosphate 3-phosphatidyltransferase
MKNLKNDFALFLHRLGVTADAVTYFGLAVALVAAWQVYLGNFFAAGALLLFSGGLDLMDGAIARASNKTGYFGGVLDSTLDRYGDGAVLGAAAIYCAAIASEFYAFLALSALIGSFSISYVRARTECEIDACRVGFWERGERLVVLAAALLLDNLTMGLWLLGTLTHFTVLYRLYYASSPITVSAAVSSSSPVVRFFMDTRRKSLVYAAKLAVLVVLIFFVRLPL